VDLSELLRFLRLDDWQVMRVCRAGSRVYGTAGPGSDEDFVVVARGVKPDLVRGPSLSVILYTPEGFMNSVEEHAVFALECLYLPPEHRLRDPVPPLTFKLDRKRLARTALSRAQADLDKSASLAGATRQKRLFHALRVLDFAGQILRTGKIENYLVAPLLEIAGDEEQARATFARLAAAML
jgi:hypothetical protein